MLFTYTLIPVLFWKASAKLTIFWFIFFATANIYSLIGQILYESVASATKSLGYEPNSFRKKLQIYFTTNISLAHEFKLSTLPISVNFFMFFLVIFVLFYRRLRRRLRRPLRRNSFLAFVPHSLIGFLLRPSDRDR